MQFTKIYTELLCFESQVKEKHKSSENVTYDLHFWSHTSSSWRWPYGHNLLLAIFRFCRKIFIEKLISKKVIKFIFNCGSHHISWQISSIA